MTPQTDASVQAIRLAWGIGISEAEADSAACVIENRKLLRPDKSETYWARALRNLMLDSARRNRILRHAGEANLYPRRPIGRNYVEDELIEAIDAGRHSNRRQQDIQLDNIVRQIMKVAGQIEHVNTFRMAHEDFITKLKAQKKLPDLRLRSTLRFKDPISGGTVLTADVSSYFSWPPDHHDWAIKRSAVCLVACPGISVLPRTIHCHLERNPVPEGAFVLDL
jgi:hypothetical protein